MTSPSPSPFSSLAQHSEHLFVPLSEEHVELVWQWRNSERVRVNMHNEQVIAWAEHKKWYESLQTDPTRECWIYCQHGRPVGVLNFSDMQSANMQWGCYLGEVNVLPGSGLVLEWAALEYTLTQDNCQTLAAEVLSFNTSALKLHKLFNYEAVGVEKGGSRAGSTFNIHLFSYAKTNWQENRLKILSRLPKPIQKVLQQVTFLEKEKL